MSASPILLLLLCTIFLVAPSLQQVTPVSPIPLVSVFETKYEIYNDLPLTMNFYGNMPNKQLANPPIYELTTTVVPNDNMNIAYNLTKLATQIPQLNPLPGFIPSFASDKSPYVGFLCQFSDLLAVPSGSNATLPIAVPLKTLTFRYTLPPSVWATLSVTPKLDVVQYDSKVGSWFVLPSTMTTVKAPSDEGILYDMPVLDFVPMRDLDDALRQGNSVNFTIALFIIPSAIGVPASYDRATPVNTGLNRTMGFPRGFSMYLDVKANTNLKVKFYGDANPVTGSTVPASKPIPLAYWEIDAPESFQLNDGSVSYSYDPVNVQRKIKEDTMAIVYLDSATNAWTIFTANVTSRNINVRISTVAKYYGVHAELSFAMRTSVSLLLVVMACFMLLLFV